MADLTKSVEIIFGATDNITPSLSKLATGFNDFNQKAREAAQPVADVAKGVAVLETAVLSLSAAFVGKAIDAAGKFGDQVTEIGTLFGGTTTQMKGFSDDVLNFAGASTQSIDSINGAIYEAVSSGVAWGDSIEYVKKNEELAVAGRANLVDVTNVMTGVLNAYGEKGKDTAENIKILSNYQDDFMTAVNIGKTTVPEMAASLSQVSTIAAAAGVPFSDLSAAIATVTSKGVPTSEAMTMIRGVLDTMIKPSSEAAKYASELGISFDVQSIKSKGLKGALDEVITATGGSSENMSKLFGNVEGLNGALILGKTGSEDFAKALQTMATNTGSVSTAYEAMSKNYEVALQRMANAADTAMIKAGQPLLDTFGSVANAIGSIFQNLGASFDSGAFSPITDALKTFGESLAESFRNIAQNLPDAFSQLDFSKLIDSFDNLGGSVADAFSKIFDNIDLSTPEGLAQAMQSIVDGIAGLNNVFSGIVQGFEPVFAAFGQLGQVLGESDQSTATSIGNFLALGAQIVAFGPILTAAMAIMDEVGISLTDVVDTFAGTAKALFNTVQVGIDQVAIIIIETVKAIFSAMSSITFGETSDYFKQKTEEWSGLLTQVKDRQAQNFAELKDGASQAAGGIDGIVTSVGNYISGTDQAVDSTGKLADGTAKVADGATKMADGTQKATESGKELVGLDWGDPATAINLGAEAATAWGVAMSVASPKAEEFVGYVRSAADETDIARAKTNGYRLEVDELGNRTFTPVIENTNKTADATKKAAKEMEDAAKKAVEYDLKLREIESKERIAYIEAKFKVDEEQIKADAAKVTAAFESINTSISSTGETLTGLVGSWAQLAGTFEGAKLWDLVENEEKRRQQAFDQQKELVNEQIKYMAARTKTLERGDTLIKVNADGVAPELERIFHEILRRCQIKANEQGLELLLAGGAA